MNDTCCWIGGLCSSLQAIMHTQQLQGLTRPGVLCSCEMQATGAEAVMKAMMVINEMSPSLGISDDCRRGSAPSSCSSPHLLLLPPAPLGDPPPPLASASTHSPRGKHLPDRTAPSPTAPQTSRRCTPPPPSPTSFSTILHGTPTHVHGPKHKGIHSPPSNVHCGRGKPRTPPPPA